MDSRPHGPAEPPEDPPDGRGPEPGDGTAGEPDVERRWAEIVAQLGDLDAVSEPDRRPDGDPGDTPGDGPPTEPASPERAVPEPSSGRTPPPGPTADPRSWAPDPVLEEAENHFEPPDPGPVLTGDPLLTMAWSAVLGVPALLLLIVLVWRDVPDLVLQIAGVAFVLGLGLLVWRMPRGDEDDDGRPGAVV